MSVTTNASGEVKDTTSCLSDKQKRAIEDTWSIVYTDPGTHGLELFLRLFKEVPHAKGYFDKFRDEPEDDLKQSEILKNHATKMMDGMNVLVGNLGNTENLVNEIQKLARDHRGRSVTSQDFKLAFEILQHLLREKLCEKYDEVASESWKACCDVIWNVVDVEMKQPEET